MNRAVSRVTELAHPGHCEICSANLCHLEEKMFTIILSISKLIAEMRLFTQLVWIT